MRRFVVVIGVLVAVGLLLAGCGSPPGVDGNLVDDWPILPEAKIVVPTAPACYAGVQAPSDLTRWPEPVPCTAEHNVELVSVGQFTGADAQRPTPPSIGGTGMRKAYERCNADANQLLGADWRTGRISLGVDLPSPTLWEAGGRWFRCDLQSLQEFDQFQVSARTSSLRDGLKPGADLLLGCVAIKPVQSSKPLEIDRMVPSACTAPHNGEFVGVFEPPDGTYPPDADTRKATNLAGCRALIVKFVGIPDDANFKYRTGQVAMPFDKQAWELGNRGVRCYVWPPDNRSSSLHAAGTAGLPITVGG